jgi:hypothetical protein
VERSFSRRSVGRKIRAAGALALLALVFPASALAHTPQATVSCTGADFSWTAFAAGPNTVHWKVTVDNATFREGTTQIGRTGSLHVPYTLNDTHTVEAFSWWAANETSDHNVRAPDSPAIAHAQLVCPASTPPASPPTVTTTPTPTPTATPAPAPVVQPAPQSVVAGTQTRAATARVAVQRSCASRSARVTITGRSIRQVTFFVNGRRARIVTVRAGARRLTVSVPLSRGGAARQRITARVTFRNGAAARTLNANARRCAQAAVQPQFTG